MCTTFTSTNREAQNTKNFRGRQTRFGSEQMYTSCHWELHTYNQTLSGCTVSQQAYTHGLAKSTRRWFSSFGAPTATWKSICLQSDRQLTFRCGSQKATLNPGCQDPVCFWGYYPPDLTYCSRTVHTLQLCLWPLGATPEYKHVHLNSCKCACSGCMEASGHCFTMVWNARHKPLILYSK